MYHIALMQFGTLFTCVSSTVCWPLLPYGYWASECLNVKNYKWWLNPVWHRMLYSCTYMATEGVQGLNLLSWYSTIIIILCHAGSIRIVHWDHTLDHNTFCDSRELCCFWNVGWFVILFNSGKHTTLHCVPQKTCDYIFYNNFNNMCFHLQ